MFTGIVEEVGQVEKFAPGTAGWSLEVRSRVVTADVRVGDSVAVNGCCLTVVRFDRERLWFDVLEETRRLTNFRDLASGAGVNLERSLQPAGRMGGHFVSGHIDGTGEVRVFEPRGKDHYLRVRAEGSGKFMVPKGSIAIDGISLTVAEVEGDEFSVWLIPHTLAATNLREKKTGSTVNLEYDLLAKYVDKLLAARGGRP